MTWHIFSSFSEFYFSLTMTFLSSSGNPVWEHWGDYSLTTNEFQLFFSEKQRLPFSRINNKQWSRDDLKCILIKKFKTISLIEKNSRNSKTIKILFSWLSYFWVNARPSFAKSVLKILKNINDQNKISLSCSKYRKKHRLEQIMLPSISKWIVLKAQDKIKILAIQVIKIASWISK